METQDSKVRTFIFCVLITPCLCWPFADALTLFTRSSGSGMESGVHSTLLPITTTKLSYCESSDDSYFPCGNPPYLALITEPDACDSDDNVKRTFAAVSSAVSNGQVDLVSIRQMSPEINEERELVIHRLVNLAKQLMDLSFRFPFRLVVSSDWVEVLKHVRVHGIHVKESHRDQIPKIRQLFEGVLIGTSAHSIESALDAWKKHQPDYFFVGTCFVTQTHPEKTIDDLEGPSLPGQVVAALEESYPTRRPPVLAIGGINAENCHEPVQIYGADGVATIRAVLNSPHPDQTVGKMKERMNKKS